MVALLADIPSECGLPRPRAPIVRLAPRAPRAPLAPRPPIGVRPSRAVYWRRRVVAVAAGVLILVLCVIAARAVLVRIGGRPLTTTGATSGLQNASAQSYVVRPGDTLWTIASALDRQGDVRVLVDQLAAELGSASIYPGEVIPLPTSAR